MFDANSHTFVICAYKESEYLEECIQSLLNQKVKTNVILATSTPNEHIESLCKKYNIEMFVNTGETGITQDWNFAVSMCKTPIVTIAHQDDVYFEDYTKVLLERANEAKRPIIFFTDYCEIREGKKVYENEILKVKRFLLKPLKVKAFQKSKWWRRRVLSMGSPICCPAVSYFMDNLQTPIFKNHFRTDEDWEAWEYLSKFKGEFLFEKTVQMGHRIHAESETSAAINETGRYDEDLEMYRKFWPDFIAKRLCKAYQKSEKSNSL